MNLLTPAFLIGFAALAVPLLIHLIRRERHDPVAFPSLMFLSRIPQPVIRRRFIRNWWLFALRCLALILLVSAFARPFLSQPADAIANAAAAREVVILVDRSYSMGYGDRWERALTAAREAVAGLGTDDRASIVFFDASARAATQPTNEKIRLRAALDSARVGAGVTRYAPALKLAQSMLSNSELQRREAVLISDFQRAGWDGGAGAQLPPGAELRAVRIGDDAVSNMVVTRVTLDRARVSGRERVAPIVHLANRGAAAQRVNVVFELSGRTQQTVAADVPAQGTRAVELQPVTLGDAPMRATVTAGTDELPIDNAFHFMLAPDPGVRVLIVEGAGGDAGLYLRPALALGEDPPIEVTTKRDGMPTANELLRSDVIIFNDVLPSEGAAGRRILEWTRAGGGVVLALGERTADAGWGSIARELAGGTAARVVDRMETGGAQLGYLDYSHPVFELFRAPRAGTFAAARFYRYRAVPAVDARPAGTDTSGTRPVVLARFDDGSPALVERPFGGGRALIWGSTLDATWSNLALEPVFLPLVHQIVKRAAGFEPARPWSTAGQVVDLAGAERAELLVTTPHGVRLDVAADRTLLTLDEQGFYQVREARAGATERIHAVNVDVSESELAALDPAEVVAVVTTPAAQVAGAARLTLAPEEQEARQKLWWWLLLVVFALLTGEAVFANRRTRRAA
ncbi:MAG TPA: BatA domain-containing protein [Longimicrobiales bacterium]|nr:BatA domain-containing protein [Longimicrobiales bacterium]